jgi:hypothetical protein
MCNPVVYSRRIDGQTNIAWFVAIIPFWLFALRHFFQQPQAKNTIMIGIIAGLWMGISFHAAYFMLVSFLTIGIAHIRRTNRKQLLARSL